MINLKLEKEKTLSTQDIYDIISFAVQAADDGGFINSFVLERAIYEYAIIMYNQDDKEELSAQVAENVNSAWDYMLDNGYVDRLISDHQDEVNYVCDCAAIWAKEYSEYAHSARGLADMVQGVTGSFSKIMMDKLESRMNDVNVREALEIADKWGMNNIAPDKAEQRLTVEDGGKSEQDENEPEDGSLFDK